MPDEQSKTTAWQPIETAPKGDDEVLILAHFRPGYHYPDYAVAASWGTAMPSYIQCASYSGWFVEGVPLADPPRRRGVNVANGILPSAEMAPTHWMRCPKHDRT